MQLVRKATTMTRAEQIRKRREQEMVERQVQPRLVEQKTAPVIPVFSRTKMPASTSVRSHTHGVRRSVYYQVPRTGAEVRLPSVPTFKPGWKLLSGTIAALMFALILFVSLAGDLKVSKVVITGLQRLNSIEVEAALNLGDEPIVTVDTVELAKQLAYAYPELANIRVRVKMPTSVYISTYERVPLMTWATNEQVFWIDMEGYIFPPRGDVTPPLYIVSNELPPIVENPAGWNSKRSSKIITDQLTPAILSALRELSSRMPLQTQFVYSTQDGLGWVDTRGWAVFVGMDFTDLTVKINEYQAIADALDRQGIRPVMVSVEHVDAPFFRTE
jgi:hypothetical protein